MTTFTEISIYVIQALANIYLLILLLRLLLQLCKANFYNPVSQFVVKATNLPMVPMAKILPAFKNFNMAIFALAILFQMVTIQASVTIYNGTFVPPLSLLIWSLLGMAAMLLNIYFYGLLIVIVLSWVAPQSHHPAISLLWQLMDPVMTPFRKIIPPLGGLDLSPILLFLILNVLRIMVRNIGITTHLPALFVPGIM
jgi:YggT family protein